MRLGKNQDSSKFRRMIVFYLDILVRSLIAFVFIGVGSFIFLVGLLKIKVIYVLPVTFLITIFISPLLSRIRVSEKLLNKYEFFLNKSFKLK